MCIQIPYFLDQNPRVILVSAFQNSRLYSSAASIGGRLLLIKAPTFYLNGKICTKARLAEELIAFQLKFCGPAIG